MLIFMEESKKKMYLKFEKEKKKKKKRKEKKSGTSRKNFIALMPGTNRCSYYLSNVSVKHLKSTF